MNEYQKILILLFIVCLFSIYILQFIKNKKFSDKKTNSRIKPKIIPSLNKNVSFDDVQKSQEQNLDDFYDKEFEENFNGNKQDYHQEFNPNKSQEPVAFDESKSELESELDSETSPTYMESLLNNDEPNDLEELNDDGFNLTSPNNEGQDEYPESKNFHVFLLSSSGRLTFEQINKSCTKHGLILGDDYTYYLLNRQKHPFIRVLNAQEPGTFDKDNINYENTTSGIILLLSLPVLGMGGQFAMKEMIRLAKKLEFDLGCKIYDESGHKLVNEQYFHTILQEAEKY